MGRGSPRTADGKYMNGAVAGGNISPQQWQTIVEWLSAKDMADALNTAISAGLKAAGYQGNEIQVNVRELVEIICRLAGGPRLEPVVLNDAPNEIPHQYLSAAKARRQLGWAPAYSLEQGMAETIDWYREYFAELNQAAAAAPSAGRQNRR